MNSVDLKYFDLLANILKNGEPRQDRTGVGTLALFGEQIKFDLSEGFPILTTKRVHFPSVAAELIWFLSGSTNNEELKKMGCSIWDEWAAEDGELGRIYGAQWRSWLRPDGKVVDQIANLSKAIKEDPHSRRHILSAWNVGELDSMALSPCHMVSQFYVSNDGKLSCNLYQRSCDVFLGLPFNIASYALLTNMMAHTTGLKVGMLNIFFGDVHLYNNHQHQANVQMKRTPFFGTARLWLNPEIKNITDFKMEDIKLLEYMCHKALPAKVAV